MQDTSDEGPPEMWNNPNPAVRPRFPLLENPLHDWNTPININGGGSELGWWAFLYLYWRNKWYCCLYRVTHWQENTWFVQYVDSLSSNLRRQHAGREPPLLTVLQKLTFSHTFCLSCITQALQSSSLCPIDRLPISSDDVKPAPKIVASLVNELVVSCPRGCGVDVERGCLKGHLKGTCELELLSCSCGESITRRDLQYVHETERWEVDDQVPESHSGCIHEWQQCPHCSGSYQRLHKTVRLPLNFIFWLP